LHHRGRVKTVACNRVAQGLQMHAKLVAAAGQRLEFEAACLCLDFAGDTAPSCHAGLPFRVDRAKGSIGPVDQNRQVNGLPLRVDGQNTCDTSHLAMFNQTVFKRRIEFFLC